MQVSPKYLLLGGIMGAFITLTVIMSMNTLGPAKAALLIVVSQIAVAYVIELFGLFGTQKVSFAWPKLLDFAWPLPGSLYLIDIRIYF